MQIRELEKRINNHIKNNRLDELSLTSWDIRSEFKKVINEVFNIKDNVGQNYELTASSDTEILLYNKYDCWYRDFCFKFKRKKKPGYSMWGIKEVKIICTKFNNIEEYKNYINHKVKQEEQKKKEELREKIQNARDILKKHNMNIKDALDFLHDWNSITWDVREFLKKEAGIPTPGIYG